MIKRFFFVLFCFTLNCIITESKESQIACIYNKTENNIIVTFWGISTSVEVSDKLCDGTLVESPITLDQFYGGKLLIKDSSDTVLFDLTGSAIDEAFIKKTGYYYILDVN